MSNWEVPSVVVFHPYVYTYDAKKRLLIPGPRFEKPMAEIHKLQSIKKQLNTIPLSYGGVTVL